MRSEADGILAADIHIRHDVPPCRTDDYIQAMWRKWLEIIYLSVSNGSCPIFIAGDLGHRSEWPDLLIRTFIQHCKNNPNVGPIVVVPGQHDLPSHNISNWEKSPLGILEADNTIVLLDGKGNSPFCVGQVAVYDYPWGMDFSARRFKPVERPYKMAISHQLVMEGKGNRADFPGADFEFAVNILKANPKFDLILTGDNHKSFVTEYEGRFLVNPGSMMRSVADQVDHEPSVYLWYATQNKVEQHILHHEKGVITREHIEQEKAKEARMEAFIQAIQGGEEISLSFEENMVAHLQQNKVSDIIKQKVWECVK